MKKMAWVLAMMFLTGFILAKEVSAQTDEEMAAPESAATLDAALIDPNVLIGNWVATYSGGKTLTTDGKTTIFIF